MSRASLTCCSSILKPVYCLLTWSSRGNYISGSMNECFYFQVGSLSWSVLPGKVMFRDVAYITKDYTIRVQDGHLVFRWWRRYVPKDVSEDLSYILGKNWRDLIPVIKIDVSCGKIVFGNRLLPTTLVISAEEAHLTYSTKPAGCSLDHFMHFIKAKAETFKVLLAPSPKYTGMLDEAPRYMGEGFVVVSSNELYLYHYMDQAGNVPSENHDSFPLPEWGVDIRCGKGTNFSYGPWADRQRELIYKFFFPPDYRPQVQISAPQPGEKRVARYFRIRLSTECESSLDVLFSKLKETNAVHVNMGPGTNFEFKLPWFVDQKGYTSTLSGTLMMVEATTSLQYRELLKAETLQMKILMNFPIHWNDHQEWLFSFVANKLSLQFLFAHKWFFEDLLDDWAAKSPQDLIYFVPYTWKIDLTLKQFELYSPTNEFNWLDTSSTSPENSYMGICGQILKVAFDLPNTEFLPDSIPFLFDISGEVIDLVLYLHPTNTSHDILKALDDNAKLVTQDGKWKWKRDGQETRWRSACKYADGWIDCWFVPKAALQIEFIYHPVPLPGPSRQAESSTPEKEKLLLTPLRAPISNQKQLLRSISSAVPKDFDPFIMEADRCSVRLFIDQSTGYLFGTLIRSFMHLKENIFGEDQQFTPMDSSYGEQRLSATHSMDSSSADMLVFDPRLYRPIDVILDLTFSNVQAHLMKNCNVSDTPCPFAIVERITFEMDKNFRETRLQLILSPVVLRIGALLNKSQGNPQNENLRQGHLLLTGLQFRGHAMFSEVGRPLGRETLEYGWLIEIQCGSLLGKVTASQLYSVFLSLETLIFLVVDKENVLKHPRPFKVCQHDHNQKECPNVRADQTCPTVEEVKYRMVRFLIDYIDIQVVEKVSCLKLKSCPIRFAVCNLHGPQTKQGMTALIKQVTLRQYVSSNFPLSRADIDPSHHGDIWIETGSVKFGPVVIEGGLSGYSNSQKDFQKEQHDFLQKHDHKSRRMWFLWPQALTKVSDRRFGKCGCVGGCDFFGNNTNGEDFFLPQTEDINSSKNVAFPVVRDKRENPGFGQSIIHDHELAVQGVAAFGFPVDTFLPPNWPHSCHEPIKLPFCPDFRTHKSNSSHYSDTPKHPKYHRSFSGKHGTPQTLPGTHPRRKRSISTTSEAGKLLSASGKVSSGSKLNMSSSSDNVKSSISKACSLIQVPGEKSSDDRGLKTMGRTESLVSDVLSFYSLEEGDSSSKVSVGLSSPKSLRSPSSISSGGKKRFSSSSPTSTQYESASQGITSPLSMDYHTASQGASSLATSPMTSLYETATSRSGGRSSSAMSFDTPTLQPDSPQNLDALDEEGSDTLSRVDSSGSFISAVSDQDDLGMVNLHMQVNKPITESPLLMSSYISHLTQLRCSHWNESVGVLPHEPQNQSVPFLSQFDMIEEGFSAIEMQDKEERELLDETITNKSDWDGPIEFSANRDQSSVMSNIAHGNTSKATVIVRFQGSIDIICCPIMLESLEKTCTALTNTFQNIHPMSVVNHLHSTSVDRVESRNTLKKERSLDLQEKLIIEPKETKHKKADKEPPPPDTFRTFEKSISSFVQASMLLPKVNVMVLQASVVEEMCSFSALDRVKDITCVSLLAVGIKRTSFQFCKTSQSKKIVQIYLQNQKPSGKKKKSKYKIPDLRQNEPFAFESSETQREEVFMTGSMEKVHAQLRRLRNDSSILQDASITAIPNHRSKVFFDYVNVPRLSNDRVSTPIDDPDSTLKRKRESELKMGYNMCECGLEGLGLKVAKRSSNQEVGQTERLGTADQGESMHVVNEKDNEDVKSHGGESNASGQTLPPDEDLQKHGQGKTSTASGSVEIKASWFNFAAPPKTPISKKIDFTKLDWNLLSTASPSIDAWLGPIDRFQGAVAGCIQMYHLRLSATMAALMADSLDVATDNFLSMGKHDKLTALSRTLRDDPSCQLCSILLKYMLKGNLQDIETNLNDGVPPLTTIRQGIVVLSRQWKNALYTPILIEYNLRYRSLKNIYGAQMNLAPVHEETLEDTELDDEDVSSQCSDSDPEAEYDEEALLLRGSNPQRFTLKNGSVISDMSASLRGKLSPVGAFSPLSDDIVLFERNNAPRLTGNRASVVSGDSNEFIHSVPSELLITSGDASPSHLGKDRDESLYEWMKRQQSVKEVSKMVDDDKVTITIKEDDIKSNLEKVADSDVIPQTKAMHLLDAHIIFEPLLSSLGLMPQQIQNLSLKNLGYNMSFLGHIDEVRVDIIESEIGKRSRLSLNRKATSSRRHLSESSDSSSPAFICEKVCLQTDLKKITDINTGDKSRDNVVPLYMSRAQLKRHTSTLINFSIDVHQISQRVNMPLLRLANQIVTMHLNVKETNEELKENKPTVPENVVTGRKDYMRHKKSSSDSSTSSNVSSVPHRTPKPEIESSVIQARNVQTTPSPSMTMKSSLKNRPKSFAQKFRPNSRLAGYSNMESPIHEQQDSFVLTSAPLEMITEELTTIKCWKTMYNLLELYSTMPTTKTVQRQSLTPTSNNVVNLEAGILQKGAKRTNTPTHTKEPPTFPKTPDLEMPKVQTPGEHPKRPKEVSFAKADASKHEHTPFIVFGVAKIRKTKLMATLSGLKLEGEINGLQSSMQYREKIRAPLKGTAEVSVTGHMEETNIVLLEGLHNKEQTVVKVKIGKSQVIYTSHIWKNKDRNNATMAINLVQVEIPQHPVSLHGIVTRGTKELSSTLQEFRGTRILQRGKNVPPDDLESSINQSPKFSQRQTPSEVPLVGDEEKSALIKPFVMQFHVIMHKMVMSAALLPSLKAEYSMRKVSSKGMTGSKANFIIDMSKHTLSFNTKLEEEVTDANLPSEASIDLPKVYVKAEYVQDDGKGAGYIGPDGSVLSQGNYLNADAEIGELEHCLTTDLLNHLVFVQKVFMREVNDVVQKMSGSDRPVPVWTEFGELEFYPQNQPLPSQEAKRLLFSVSIRLNNITITATTPASSGVRFETGQSEFHISNRVQSIEGSPIEKYTISTMAKVYIRLSLGQLIRDPIYFEAEPQFHQQAYFRTTIQLRNALQGEKTKDSVESSDAIYITLDRPLIFVQPIAVDRAILFWLSYKNAWEYWTEQRLNLNKDVLVATEQVLEKVPISQITSQLSAPHVGTVFLQVNVKDIGICVPLSLDPVNALKADMETRGAIVATVESTSISSCSARSTVSKGKFQDLCVRFTDDFNHFLDDWKPDPKDSSLMNLCIVSEGSYEICSHTEKAIGEENAKWLLNIAWQMTGVDVHVDTNIGKHLTALGNTLTSFTGAIDEESTPESRSISEDDDIDLSSSDDLTNWRRKNQQIDMDLPSFLFDTTLSKGVIAKYLEHQINEQAKTVEDLQKLGASKQTVSCEIKKLNELQNIASKNFRLDLVEKIRRQKSRASYFKEKFGLGFGGGGAATPHKLTAKSKSLCIPSPTAEDVDFLRFKEKRKASEMPQNPSFDEDSLDGSEPETRFRRPTAFVSKASTIEEEEDVGAERGASSSSRAGSDGGSANLSPRTSTNPNLTSASMKTLEPNVDFEFQVEIFINSGKCVLHTMKEEEKRKMRKDRSFSGNLFDSPNVTRRSNRGSEFKSVHSSTRLRDMRGMFQDITTFYIPGLDVRVHYISKTDDNGLLSSGAGESFREHSFIFKKSSSAKKGTLVTWMTLQSIPEETIITPTILEFLEQALDPLPTFNPVRGTQSDDGDADSENDPDSNSGSQTGLIMPPSYSSFPVDVIVYFHMQSSTFRFSCLPVSRVECMLRLPSLDLVFSSKRADGEIVEEFGDSPSKSRWEDLPESDRSRWEDGTVMGGLSVTGCLNDFSLYVFHPYGGGRKQKPEEMNFSPLTSEERKDSLSVNVAFVKFQISRSRKLNFDKISLESSQRIHKLPSLDPKGSIACVRFSTIVDIGSASFKYDMRRLSEIMAFPKAWYRRALVRRLFLGELRTTSFHTEKEAPPSTPIGEWIPKSTAKPTTSRRQSVSQGGQAHSKEKRVSISQVENQKKIWIGQTTAHSWETLVMIAINFKELKVQMNMGNVMGNVDWISKNLHSRARLSIASTGHKNMAMTLGLHETNFEAKAGIVGGAINIGKVETFAQLKEDSGIEPFHKFGLQLDVMEIKFDYMGSSILMGRISHLKANINDDWHVTEVKDNDTTMHPAQIFIQGDLNWDQLQLMISKSTTADLLKIAKKMEEFFAQQFKSSKKLFSSFEPGSWSNKANKKQPQNIPVKEPSLAELLSISHHRHWQRALKKISAMKIYTLPFKLPEIGSVLGGILELRGKHISLACFHGINFKSKSWALFSLKDPSISFTSDAQDFFEEQAGENGASVRGMNTTIIQTLTFALGQANHAAKTYHGYMATVKKISRGVKYLPPVKTLSEWFNYAFKSSELDEVERFPSIGASNPVSESKDKDEVTQKTEDIFALPCLTMDLKTKHVQTEFIPLDADPKPKVDCTFITDFDNHIYVTTDAEAFFFLHDLITSYVKEKERVIKSQLSNTVDRSNDRQSMNGGPAASNASAKGAAKDSSAGANSFDKDWRLFDCTSWHLEPTVRLISWAGSEIEPYGVDYILQRLGFNHARTTIPKWLQRGCMDPLDKVMSIIVLRTIQMVQEEKKLIEEVNKRGGDKK
eukprot:maker-scaffold230_size244653-snap-gene-0.11 protein:Tk08238 transcript:maker-scaffold230_size244653-snap-gene-0.11-mRNA-1 annotation:"PREDICTED: uncharacterized protein KIAA1109-like isoform X7"